MDAPGRVEVALPVTTVEPTVTTAEAAEAKAMADRVTAEIALAVGDDTYKIATDKLRKFVTFQPTVVGGYTPVVNPSELDTIVTSLAKKIDRKPLNATYRTSGGKISSVVASRDGRKLDVEATVASIRALLTARADGATTSTVEPAVTKTEPALTTAEAKAAARR